MKSGESMSDDASFNTPRFVSENLIKYRKRAGLTQQSIADILGINRTTYTKYETGVCEPSLAMIEAIVNVLKIDVNTLFYDGREPGKVGEGVMFLSAEERDMLLSYRSMTESEQKKLAREIRNGSPKTVKGKMNKK